MPGYRAPRTGRRADRYADTCRRLCEARQHDSQQPVGGGSGSIAISRAPQRAPARKPASDSDGDSDGESAPDLAQLVNTLIERIAELSKPSIPVDIDLWDTKTIGAYLKRDIDVVRERIVCMPSFPSSIRIPNAKGQRMQPLWRAAEVISWAESFRNYKTAA